jgi:RNA polymerase sigma factor (sigma-70 family)
MHASTTTETRTRVAEAVPRAPRRARRRHRDDPGGAKAPGGRRYRRERRRSARGEIDKAALRVVSRHGAQILATARRYAATPEDAEDAYQRAFEILLTKAPTTSEVELVPWLKTVVKHEAFALRRQRQRHAPVTHDCQLGERPTPPEITHDQAERYERLSQAAEALRMLKPHETRGLRLRAEGYSYKEICRITGWT